MKNFIWQRSLDQKGVIITTKGRQIPFYKGEDVLKLIAKVKGAGFVEEENIESVFECFTPCEISSFETTELKNALLTGFMGVEPYGYNMFIDTDLYC